MTDRMFLHSTASTPPLRLALLTDGSDPIEPFARVLRHLQACDFVALVVVLEDRDSAGREGAKANELLAPKSRSSKRHSLLYSRYLDWDQKRNHTEFQTFSTENCSGLLGKLPRISGPFLGSSATLMTPQVAQLIGDARVDVIFNVSRAAANPALMALARHGIWSHQFGSPQRWGDFATFWSVSEEAPLTDAFLLAQSLHPSRNVVLAQCRIATQLGTSHVVNLRSVCRSIETLLIWKLKQLHELGWEALTEGCDSATPSPSAAIERAPGNPQMAHFLARKITRAVGRRLRTDRRIRQWQVGIRRDTSTAPWEGAWNDFRWINPVAGHFYADPQLFEHRGRLWLFLEDFAYHLGHGIVSACEVAADGSLGPMIPVLQRPYHLSFPFVFEQNGEIYLLPETAQAGRVELYRATEFPFRWELYRVLLDLPAHDTIVHVGEDGTHYFFMGIRQYSNANEHQFVYLADNLDAELRMHPASPISLDARYSRNAGPLIQHDGKLVRISQDSTVRYGRQLRFSQIDLLTPERYRERELGQRQPDWGSDFIGTHSYCRAGGWEVVDALRLTIPKQLV